MKAQTIMALLFIVLAVNACNKVYKNNEVVYNCDLAEISPDFPIEVKQKCRELKKWKLHYAVTCT